MDSECVMDHSTYKEEIINYTYFKTHQTPLPSSTKHKVAKKKKKVKKHIGPYQHINSSLFFYGNNDDPINLYWK